MLPSYAPATRADGVGAWGTRGARRRRARTSVLGSLVLLAELGRERNEGAQRGEGRRCAPVHRQHQLARDRLADVAQANDGRDELELVAIARHERAALEAALAELHINHRRLARQHCLPVAAQQQVDIRHRFIVRVCPRVDQSNRPVVLDLEWRHGAGAYAAFFVCRYEGCNGALLLMVKIDHVRAALAGRAPLVLAPEESVDHAWFPTDRARVLAMSFASHDLNALAHAEAQRGERALITRVPEREGVVLHRRQKFRAETPRGRAFVPRGRVARRGRKV